MKKLLSVLMIFATVLSFAACGGKAETETTAAENAVQATTNKDGEAVTENEDLVETVEAKGTVIGSYDPGEIGIYVDVTNKAGETYNFTVYTDQTKLGPALISKSFIDGEESAEGYVLKTVNGETHNYETEGYAWKVYVEGEPAETTVDAIELKNGATYAFKVETF